MEIVLAMLTGLVYVVSPGPVNVETLRRGWTNGFQGALFIQMGALIGDMLYAILAWSGIGFLVMNSNAQTLLGATGATMLVYLGGSSLYQGWNTITLEKHKSELIAAQMPNNESSNLPDSATVSPSLEHKHIPASQILSRRRAIVSTITSYFFHTTASEQAPVTTAQNRIFENIKSLCAGIILALANPYGIIFWLSVESAILQHTQYQTFSFLSGFFIGGLLASLSISLLSAYLGSLKTVHIFQLVSRSLGIILIGFGLILGYNVVLGV